MCKAVQAPSREQGLPCNLCPVHAAHKTPPAQEHIHHGAHPVKFGYEGDATNECLIHDEPWQINDS